MQVCYHSGRFLLVMRLSLSLNFRKLQLKVMPLKKSRCIISVVMSTYLSKVPMIPIDDRVSTVSSSVSLLVICMSACVYSSVYVPRGRWIDETMATCVGCEQRIVDQYLLRVDPDMEWHVSCLRCNDCRQYLDEFCTCFIRDGKTYCKQDYIRYSVYIPSIAKHCVLKPRKTIATWETPWMSIWYESFLSWKHVYAIVQCTY